MTLLTKSLFLSAKQCPKRLWYEAHDPVSSPGTDTMTLMNGRAVDRVVQQLHPGAIIAREGGLTAALEQTRRALDQKQSDVLYQAAFRDGSLAAVADVLRAKGPQFELIEVKAATGLKSEHLPDIAFQTLVLERAGLSVSDAYLGHVNSEFVLRKPADYTGLLVEAKVTAEVRALLPAIAEEATKALSLIAESSPPEKAMGSHCTDPHPCPFSDRCIAIGGPRPKYPLSIPPRGAKVAAGLAALGYTDLRDVPADRLSNSTHQRVRHATVTGKPVLDRAATVDVRALRPPFSYLDFETMNFAVPEIIGTRPYEQYPFQWSLHVEASDGGPLEHSEYLEVAGFADSGALAIRLLEALPSTGPIFVYNRTLEKGALELLARLVPELAPRLRAVVERLYDLLPITRAAYYHPAMLGSWSIKTVLPTLDPALGYEGLEEIQDGEAAQLAFLKVRDPGTTAQRREQLSARMRKYCERDTFAMVILRRYLCAI